MRKTFRARKSIIAASIAMAMAAPLMAQQLTIDQRFSIDDDDLDQVAENLVELYAEGLNPSIKINLGVDSNGQLTLGNTQFAGQQLMTVGLGTLGVNLQSAQNVSATDVQILQGIWADSGTVDDSSLRQRIENVVGAVAEPDDNTLGNVAVRGVSQLGVNAMNGAGVNMVNGGLLDLRQLVGPQSEEARYEQVIENVIFATVLGNGNVLIDGANGAGLASRSTQYGGNLVNTALVAAPSTAADPLTIKLQQGLSYNDDNGDGYGSRIENRLFAFASNMSAPQSIDPIIRNMDQVAVFNGNSLSIVNTGVTTLAGNEGVVEQRFQNLPDTGSEGSGYAENITSVNVAFAINSPFAGSIDGGGGYINIDEELVLGIGQASIDKLGQTILTTLNTVSIAGPTTTTTQTAGLTNVGRVDLSGTSVETFTQSVSGFRVTQAARLYDGDPDDFDFEIFVNDSGTGNLALAITGLGNAAATNLNQLQSIVLNSFSTNGALVGAVTTDGLSGGVSLRQEVLDLDPNIGMENIAAAYTRQGTATVSGAQTLALSMNNLSVSGAMSGNYVQQFDTNSRNTDIDLVNSMVALSNNGSVVIGDQCVSCSPVASPVSQTIISSINTMSIGTLGSANILQSVADFDDLELTSVNQIYAGATRSVSVGNINQTVLNRVNSISAINPTPSQ